MAIKKKLIHINEFTNFNSMKLSANVNNTQYTVGVDGAVTSGTPDILWQSIVWIKDTKQQWTHGVLYDLDDSVYVLPFTANDLMNSADNEGEVIWIEGYVNEIDEAIKANKTFMVKQDSNSMWNVVFLEIVKLSPFYQFICIFNERIVKGKITISGNYATTMSCVDFTPYNIQNEIANGSSNVYIADDFSYEDAKDQQFRVSSEFIQAIYDNKVILVPLYPSGSSAVGYAIVETPEIDSTEIYFNLRYGAELIQCYGGITDDGYAEIYAEGILNFVSDDNLKTINGESIVGSGDIIISGGSEITEDTVSGWGFTKNTGTITQIKANGTSVATSGVANIPAASTSAYGVTKLSSSTSSTSTTLAATSSAVKAAYDLANSKGNGTITGITMNGASKGTSGVVNLGTVITAHQDISGKADDNTVVHKSGSETITGAKTFNSGVHFLGSGDSNAVTLSTNTRINVNGTTKTVLGFGSGTFYINHGDYSLLLRGKDTRPTYNSSELALSSDVNNKQDKLVSGTNIKTINGTSLLGSGDIVISGGSGGSGGSGAYSEVSHGTSDTTFTLTPNTFHVWDEVTSLDLDFGEETSGVANEYLFQFTSGSTATTLTLPDDIKWANDTAPTIEANKTYQVSVLKGLGSVLEFSDLGDLIINKLTITSLGFDKSTFTFAYPVASEISIRFTNIDGITSTVRIPIGSTSKETLMEPGNGNITNVIISPDSDNTYIYTI